MSNLDKLRAKNKAAQEMKAQNQAKKSENLVDDIIQSGISYEEASGDDSQNENQKEKNTEEIVNEAINENNEENEKKVLATEGVEQALNYEERNNVSLETENAVEPPLNAPEGKTTKRTTKGRRNTKTSEEQQTIKAAISLVASKKENKSVRKSFLIKESSNEKLKILADQLGTSENDVINQILESVLSDVE